jgi:hemerythrin-like metal-binding protein
MREEDFTGNAVIDAQHQTLVELLNSTIESVRESCDLEDIFLKLFELQTYVDYHFRCEEIEMGVLDDPEEFRHINHHHNLLYTLNKCISHYGSRHIKNDQLIEEICQCLLDHICKDSQQIKSYIHQHSLQ